MKITHGDENGDETKLLLILKKEPGITAKRLAEKTGFSTRKISRLIKELRENEKIKRIGSDRKGYWEINKF
ncbi:MAG: winged helix-turn-helix transcriptional regulator [Lachnospiraceae bacterium]|nr:winged helix-turn-helix transcriptional regulator [Lachnospiraceae bacterium]